MCMYACVYMHIYIHTYIYIVLPKSIHQCICTYMSPYIHLCRFMCVFLPISIPVETHACVSTYLHTCLHVYIYNNAYLHTYILLYTHIYTDSCMFPTYIHMNIYPYTYLHTYVYMSQALKLGYERNVMTCALWGKGNRTGMLVDVQVSQNDSTVHVWRFFLPKVQKQRTVTSSDDVTDVLLMYIGGRDKKEAHTRPRGSVHWSFSQFQVFWLVPWLLPLGSHWPSNLATLVPLEEWNYNLIGKCYLFVQLYVLKVILGTLSWCALVVCKLVR